MIYKRETGAYNRGYAQGYKDAKAEQPAQPERINGRWIYSSYDCDQCGYMTNIEETNFCPNCGADMRGEKQTNI